MFTIIREGCPPVRGPFPPTCTLKELMANYASHVQVHADALQVSHQGCPLDPHRWALTVTQLGFGPSEVHLHVTVIQPTPTPPSAPTPEVDALLSLLQAAENWSIADDAPVSATSQATQLSPPAASTASTAGTVHVTMHIEGRAAWSREGSADCKLCDLLAHATGLPLDALQVAHNGGLVDRAQWACSFAELAWGPRAEVYVKAELPNTPVQPQKAPLQLALTPQ